MKLETLQQLHCPYCGSNLELAREIDTRQGEIIQGIVACSCSSHPLVEGILVLRAQGEQGIKETVQAMQARQVREAFFSLIKPRSIYDQLILAAKQKKAPFADFAKEFRRKLVNRSLHKVIQANSFSAALDGAISGEYNYYFKYRFSNTSFIAGIPLILLIKDFAGDILEIGSGMGHHGFLISQLYPQRKLVCIDFSFVNLYFTKRFFSPGAEYICLDLNHPLPFSDKSFNAVFSSDCFHYIDSKNSAIHEISRVSAANALMLFSHLHNQSSDANSLNADGWRKLFCFLKAKLVPEPQIFNNFFIKDELDLSGNPGEQELHRADAFAMIAADREEVFGIHPNIGEPFFNLKNRILINPVYRILSKDNKIVLQKRWPSAYAQAENISLDKLLPETCILDEWLAKEVSQGSLSELDTAKIAHLLRKFILINTPKNY